MCIDKKDNEDQVPNQSFGGGMALNRGNGSKRLVAFW